MKDWRLERGEWNGEPDSHDFSHAGLQCAIRRNYSGAWCGYVEVPTGHPLYGKEYQDTYQYDQIDVHGGLTFSGEWVEKGGWWFGFDCNHSGDLAPGMKGHCCGEIGEFYRNMDYVMRETRNLADQLATIAANAATVSGN